MNQKDSKVLSVTYLVACLVEGKYISGLTLVNNRQREQVGPSINLKIKVTLEELYLGQDFEVTYNRKVICPHCRGSGADDPDDVKECPKCGGKGQILTKKQLAPGFV